MLWQYHLPFLCHGQLVGVDLNLNLLRSRRSLFGLGHAEVALTDAAASWSCKGRAAMQLRARRESCGARASFSAYVPVEDSAITLVRSILQPFSPHQAYSHPASLAADAEESEEEAPAKKKKSSKGSAKGKGKGRSSAKGKSSGKGRASSAKAKGKVSFGAKQNHFGASRVYVDRGTSRVSMCPTMAAWALQTAPGMPQTSCRPGTWVASRAAACCRYDFAESRSASSPVKL